MRADFLGHALAYPPLTEVLKADIKLGAMNREKLSLVIEKPAASLDVKFEPGLVERLLDDIEESSENIALLEFALTELWQKQTDNKLTHQAYEDIGQVKGALADYAEEVYKKLGDKEKKQARQIFTQLVRLGEEGHKDTRRVVNRNQIGEENWQLVTRKDGLAKSRLVVTNLDRNQRETLEVVHEALIRHWHRLQGWLDDNRDALRKHREIEEDAKTWADHHKSLTKGYLWEKYKLAEAEKVLQEYDATVQLSKLAQEFLEECRKQELCSYLLAPASDNLNQIELEKEAAAKSFLTKPRLWHLLKDESEKAKVRLGASWVLKQWGEDVPMWLAEIDEEEQISLHIVEPPPTEVEDLGNGISLEMVKIPGGEFWMGAAEGEDSEKPQHKVKVSPFFMGKYLVTQAQWLAVASLPGVERKLDLNPSDSKGDNRPVEMVSWDDAVEFCKRLTRKTGKDYRLPSEAEWEYACRARTTTLYHFGQTILPSLANLQATGGGTTTVGRFQVANRFGLYDMHGNVWEWCEDDWHDDYQGAPTDGSAWIRRSWLESWSKGADNKNVIRGGSWGYATSFCRSAFRYTPRADRSDAIGVRVVCVASRTTQPSLLSLPFLPSRQKFYVLYINTCCYRSGITNYSTKRAIAGIDYRRSRIN